jgi:dipeptidyl aminopeptidase/acylaminoacyl peptidase
MGGIAGFLLATTVSAQEPKPFTLQQILSAPYASQLTAAPTGPLFAWTEDAEGRHNLFVGGKDIPARQLTHNTEDDAQDISQLAWSPDAKFIAYTFGAPSGADGKPANPAHLQRPTPVQVIIQPVDGSAPTVVGEGRSPLFTRDRKNLLFTRAGQIFTLSFRSGAEESASPASPQNSPHQLVFDRGTASSLTLSPDGQTLAFISRRREANEPSHSFLALYTFATHTLTFPAPSTGNDSAPAFSPDGKQLAWLRSPFTEVPEFALNRTSANPWSIQLLDLEAKTTHTIYSPEPNKPGSVLPHLETGEPPLFWYQDATGDLLFFASEASGHNALYLLQPGKNVAPFRFTEQGSEVEDVTLSGDGLELLYTVNTEDDIDRRHIRSYVLPQSEGNLGEMQETMGAGIESMPVSLHDHAPGTRGQMAALVSDARTPTHPALIKLPMGATPAIITALRSDYLPSDYPTTLVTPHQVIFPSTDNLQIHSQLFLPKNLDPHKKHPAILFFHGGPMRQMLLGYPAMDYYSNAYAMNQYLTSRGFIVLSVNYRCGIGYGLDFRQCDHEGATGAAEYNDVLAAAKYLQSRPDVDAKRIGLWGGSYGGYLTALGLARNSDLFAAGVDFHGVHDWNLEDNASDWKQGSFAQQDAIAAKALASSPLSDLSKWKSPVLLIHGDNDPDVAYAQTPHLADALRARNSKLPPTQQVDVQELIFPDELHGFLLHRDWLAAYTATAAFFERTLKPEQVK